MALTRKSLADTLDAYDDEIAVHQEGKRETLQAYRAQLATSGMAKDEVKAEVEAVKAAVRRRRAVREKGAEAVDHKDALADEIFEEITGFRAPRATRVENTEKFDPDLVLTDRIDSDGNRLRVVVDSRVATILAKSETANSAPTRAEGGSAPPPEAPAAIQPGTANENPERSVDYPADPLRSEVATREDAKSATPGPSEVVFFHTAADPRCLDPDRCGAHSLLGLCGRCKEAAGLPVHREAAE